MAWVDSLSPADIAELRQLADRTEVQIFLNYVILAITIRTLGPIPIADMGASDDVVWKKVYADCFQLRADGCVHLLGDPPHLKLVKGARP